MCSPAGPIDTILPRVEVGAQGGLDVGGHHAEYLAAGKKLDHVVVDETTVGRGACR